MLPLHHTYTRSFSEAVSSTNWRDSVVENTRLPCRMPGFDSHLNHDFILYVHLIFHSLPTLPTLALDFLWHWILNTIVLRFRVSPCSSWVDVDCELCVAHTCIPKAMVSMYALHATRFHDARNSHVPLVMSWPLLIVFVYTEFLLCQFRYLSKWTDRQRDGNKVFLVRK